MGFLNRLWSRICPEIEVGEYTPGSRITSCRGTERPDPDYVYVCKAPEGYVMDGGCAGWCYTGQLSTRVQTWATAIAAAHDHRTGRKIRMKKSDIPKYERP